ncbi:hypothetical protein GAYE_HPESCF16G0169 [Galdieria yellowstonensis]|uniref:Cyclin-like domain-containing protein n=1 Tax=Galdieria yellowstonensis TaxID=3028027 RepID=A0AAV9I5V2_9RHOD|nr:hypothetical protein GAYE_HPESCF16G0169 [Galdieria yellowstonensis]
MSTGKFRSMSGEVSTPESLICCEDLQTEDTRRVQSKLKEELSENSLYASLPSRKRTYPLCKEAPRCTEISQPTPKVASPNYDIEQRIKKIRSPGDVREDRFSVSTGKKEKLQGLLGYILDHATDDIVSKVGRIFSSPSFHFSQNTQAEKEMEIFSSDYDYIEKLQQGSISAAAREQIVMWMLDLREPLRLDASTIYLAVSCFDRFLAKQKISKYYLRAVAASSLWIASKFNEVEPLSARALEWLTQVDQRTLQTCELLQLSVLDWRVHDLTPHSYFMFLRNVVEEPFAHRHFENGSKIFTQEEIHQCTLLVEIFLDLCSIHYEQLRFSRLTIVLSCILCAHCVLDHHLCRYTDMEGRLRKLNQQLNINTDDLRECMNNTMAYFQGNFYFREKEISIFSKAESASFPLDERGSVHREENHTPTSITEVSFCVVGR